MSKIIFKIDLKKDLWNWWSACNKTSHGVDWKQRIDPDLWPKICGKTVEEAELFLKPYLENFYQQEINLEEIKREAEGFFAAKAPAALVLMEKVTGQPIYRDEFTIFLTTFPHGPYNFEDGQVWLPAIWSTKCYLGIFLHELLHFQFFAYFQDRASVKSLSSDGADFLKEALTVILNDEFKDFMCQPDKGYEIHQELRKELVDFWSKNKNFGELVDFGAGRVPLLSKTC